MSGRLAALIEYDGTEYSGFQRQPDRRTIQSEIESVLQHLTRERIRILGAGRTDAGVHATGQVIAFDTDWSHSLEDLHRGLNALLPTDIVVRQLAVAANGFHPRFDAVSRLYRYQMLNQAIRSPMWARYACHVARPLDVQAMRVATEMLTGTHDFATFGQPTVGESTVRNVLNVTWEEQGKLLQMYIEANGFLRSMVRCIVGTALQVGLGEITLDEFVSRFEAGERSMTSPPAPPQGLCLMAVHYDGDSQLSSPANDG